MQAIPHFAPAKGARWKVPDEAGHPSVDEMEIGAIFSALADPLRRQIVLALAASPGETRHCSSFDLPVTKATRTHHFRVLREAGLIRQVDNGNSRTNELRVTDLERRFPGLVALLLDEAAGRAGGDKRQRTRRTAAAKG